MYWGTAVFGNGFPYTGVPQYVGYDWGSLRGAGVFSLHTRSQCGACGVLLHCWSIPILWERSPHCGGSTPTLRECSYIVGAVPHCGSAPTLWEFFHYVGALPMWEYSHIVGTIPQDRLLQKRVGTTRVEYPETCRFNAYTRLYALKHRTQLSTKPRCLVPTRFGIL
jgi:hypothetical protein